VLVAFSVMTPGTEDGVVAAVSRLAGARGLVPAVVHRRAVAAGTGSAAVELRRPTAATPPPSG
jgi:hypothetical protein